MHLPREWQTSLDSYLNMDAATGAPPAQEDSDAPPQEGVPAAQVGIRPCFYWISEASLAEAIESGEDSERTMTLAERSRWLATIAKGECQDAALALPRFHGDPTAVFAGAPTQSRGSGQQQATSGQLCVQPLCTIFSIMLVLPGHACKGRAPGGGAGAAALARRPHHHAACASGHALALAYVLPQHHSERMTW